MNTRHTRHIVFRCDIFHTSPMCKRGYIEDVSTGVNRASRASK
jgi:hypothetical protein